MVLAFRNRMVDFLFGDERQEETFSKFKEARGRWGYVECEAVETMNGLDACLYIMYLRFTTDVSIITPMVNASFGTAFTKTDIDKFLVPVRALVLMKYLIEEEIEIKIEQRNRKYGSPVEIGRVYYWRYLVDNQLNEANIARLLNWGLSSGNPDGGYLSDYSNSSDGQSQCSSSSSHSSSESIDGNASDENEFHKAQTDKWKRTRFDNPVTGRQSRNLYFPPFRLLRWWDLADDKISAIIHTFPSLYAELFQDGAGAYINRLKFCTKPAMEILAEFILDCFPFRRIVQAFMRIQKYNLIFTPLRDESFDWQWLWYWTELCLVDEFLLEDDWVVTERDADDGSWRDHMLCRDGCMLQIF